MRQWTLLTIVAVLVVLAGGWFLLVQPKRDEAAELRAAAEAQDAANAGLAAEIERLKKQALDLPRQQAKLAMFASRIPSTPAMPSLIRTLTDAADRAGVELKSLSPGTPTPLQVTEPAALGTPPPLFSISVSMSVVGGYVQLQQFFSNIEDLSRSMQISTFSMTPGGQSTTGVGGLNVAMSGRVFMTTADTPAPVPVVPVASPTAAPAATPAPVSPAPAAPVASPTSAAPAQ